MFVSVWVTTGVNLLEVLIGKPRVKHRRGEVDVAEQLLNYPQISAAFKKVSRKRSPQAVRMDTLISRPLYSSIRNCARKFATDAHLLQNSRMESKNEVLAVGVSEAARMLGLSTRTIQNYIHAKILPGRKIGRRTLIPIQALKAFLRSDQPSPNFESNDGRPAC
jgi:excisionase family DNA binding protein